MYVYMLLQCRSQRWLYDDEIDIFSGSNLDKCGFRGCRTLGMSYDTEEVRNTKCTIFVISEPCYFKYQLVSILTTA